MDRGVAETNATDGIIIVFCMYVCMCVCVCVCVYLYFKPDALPNGVAIGVEINDVCMLCVCVCVCVSRCPCVHV